jgi:hypothetical protein
MNQRVWALRGLVILLVITTTTTLAVLLGKKDASSSSLPGQPWISFDNTSSPSTMTLATPLWSIQLSKTNGAVLYLMSAEGNIVSQGSNNQCLWGMWSSVTNKYVGGCNYGQPSAFRYALDAPRNTLQLQYVPPAPQYPTVYINLTATINEPWVDFSFQLIATQQSDDVYDNMAWLSEVLFNGDSINSAYLPILPGVELMGSYFTGSTKAPFTYTYPGQSGFAAWCAINTTNGSIAIFDASGPDSIVPHYWGFAPVSGGAGTNMWYWFNSLPVNISSGCAIAATPAAPTARPCTVGVAGVLTRRVQFNVVSAIDAMVTYASTNSLTALPTLAQKIGAGLSQQLATTPLLKMDSSVVNLPFAQYANRVYSQLQLPALLHYVGFEVNGFDRNYPDYLPPAPSLQSSSCDVANAIQEANAAGHLTMVYENPSWWDPTSPTLQGIEDLRPWAVLNASLQPSYETYDPVPKTGIAVCMLCEAPRNRTAALVRQFGINATLVPIFNFTCDANDVRLPMNFVFEDQLAARFPKQDFSPANNGFGYAGYAWALQQHLKNYSSVFIHTEQGVDRMAAYAVGFHGTVLGSQLSGATNGWWGDNNWRPAPLYSAIFRSNTVHFQHNLDGSAMADDVANLCWSLSLGVHLSLDVGNQPMNQSWVRTVTTFQSKLAAPFAQMLSQAFSTTGNVQTVSWGAAAATSWRNVNTSGAVTLTIPANSGNVFTLPGGSCAVQNPTAFGGGFSVYNGEALTPGWHAIVESTDCPSSCAAHGGKCVFHPYGADTPIKVTAPFTVASVVASAINGTVLSSNIGFQQSNGFVTFAWNTSIAGGSSWMYSLCP